MTLSPDQCAVIATTIPVLLLAIVFENRQLRLPRTYVNATLVVINAASFFAALTGMGTPLSSALSLLLIGNLVLTFVQLAQLVFFVDQRAKR
jgi:hypothetical protein